MPPLPPTPPRSENHTQTHTHSRFCSNHHRQTCSQSVLSKHSWRYTIEIFLFNLSHPTTPQPSPTQHSCKKKKRKKLHRAPARQKPCLCPGNVSFEESHTSQEDWLYILLMILFEYLRQAFVFLPRNLLLLRVRVLGFYHSNVNSVFPPNPFLLRRGPSLWCLKVAISLRRLWLPG